MHLFDIMIYQYLWSIVSLALVVSDVVAVWFEGELGAFEINSPAVDRGEEGGVTFEYDPENIGLRLN